MPPRIKRSPGPQSPIALDEWRRAVRSIEGVRLAAGDLVARNPFTGAEVRVPNRGGDAEVRTSGAWVRAFSWHGDGTVYSLPGSTAPESPTHRAAAALAAALGAEIVDD